MLEVFTADKNLNVFYLEYKTHYLILQRFQPINNQEKLLEPF